MHETDVKIEKAILAGVHIGSLDKLSDTTDESMAELESLAETAGLEVVAHVVQNRHAPDNGTYFGEGKLDEVAAAAKELGADIIIFDDELSPVQVRNISDTLDVRVLDRTTLILDIFASRAQTKEGKIQVELAQLKYLLPRITGMGKALSRLGAGIGTRGPGETKLETDRRHIRKRISSLNAEIKEIKRQRDLLRTRRKKDGHTVVALVGYTNAGKSSLLNLLTGADALAEDKLFATLDPTLRGLTLSDNRQLMLVDTVGFIRKLPHHLIQAFKSTLEEAALADILIHVVDVSNPEYHNHVEVVNMILAEIDAMGKPTIAAFNKVDLLEDNAAVPKSVSGAINTVAISIKDNMGIDKLVELLEDVAPGRKQHVTLLLPYHEGKLLAWLHETQIVESESYAEDGTEVSALVDAIAYDAIRNYVVR